MSSDDVVIVVHEYPEWVKHMAFSHYVACDRRPSAAHRSMLEVWDHEQDGTPPDIKTVQRWARTEDWAYKADVVVSESYPALFQRDVARMVALRSRAIASYARILEGERVENAMAIAQVARHTLDMTMGGLAVQAPQGKDEEDEELSLEERVARQRERLERGRGVKQDKKR